MRSLCLLLLFISNSLIGQIYPLESEICSSIRFCLKSEIPVIRNNTSAVFEIWDPDDLLGQGYQLLKMEVSIENGIPDIKTGTFEIVDQEFRIEINSAITLIVISDAEKVPQSIFLIPSFDEQDRFALFSEGIPFKPSQGLPPGMRQFEVRLLDEVTTCDELYIGKSNVTYLDAQNRVISTRNFQSSRQDGLKLNIPYEAVKMIVHLEKMSCLSEENGITNFALPNPYIEIPIVEENPVFEISRMLR